MQHAERMRFVVVFDLWLYRIVPHYFLNGTIGFLYDFMSETSF